MSDRFIPRDPQYLIVRPLTKGIVSNLPSNGLPLGALVDAKNYLVTTRGVRRRDPIVAYALSEATPPVHQGIDAADGEIVDIGTFWDTTGNQKVVIIGSKFMYELSGASITGKYWTYAVNTCSTSGAVATGDTTLWDTAASEIAVGDVFVLDADGSGDGPESIAISVITNDTTVTLASTPTGTYGAGTDYEIRRAFGAANPYRVDWTSISDRMVFADGTRFLYSYDGTDFTDHSAAETTIAKAKCVAFFFDRLFIGYTTESSVEWRQRIRWSSTASPYTSFGSADYLDLPYGQGGIKRLVPFGQYLGIYLDDKIYLGEKTNMADLPIVPHEIETGNVGLVGSKAVCSWLNGHFFVGQDNVYFWDSSSGKLEAIGDSVVRNTIEQCSALWRVYAVPDPLNKRIVFGFPVGGDTISQVWSFEYRAKAWSYTEFTADAIANVAVNTDITWNNLVTGGYISTDEWDTGMKVFPSWNSIRSATGSRGLYFGQDKKVWQQNEEGAEALATSVETADYDLDRPSSDKTFLELSVKLEGAPSAELTLNVYRSNDRGRNWTGPSTLTISATDDEGKINFRSTGSIVRFRVSGTSNVDSYTISEMSIKYRFRGPESRFD